MSSQGKVISPIQRLQLERDLVACDEPSDGTYRLLYRKQLALYLKRLQGIRSKTAKNLVKKEMIKDCEDYVVAVLEQDVGHQDDVLAWVFIWLCDVGDFDRAFELLLYFVKHGLTLYPAVKRPAIEFLLDCINDLFLKKSTADDPAYKEALAGRLKRLLDLVVEHRLDVTDSVLAKSYLYLSRWHLENDSLEESYKSVLSSLQIHELPAARSLHKRLVKLGGGKFSLNSDTDRAEQGCNGDEAAHVVTESPACTFASNQQSCQTKQDEQQQTQAVSEDQENVHRFEL